MTKKASDRLITVGILGASFETKNFGVAALLCGIVSSICHSYPKAQIFLLDYADDPSVYQITHPGGIATVKLINIRYSKRFYLRNNIAYLLCLGIFLKILPSCKWRLSLQRNNDVIKAIQETDIICSIAGGDSFSDIYGLGRLIYISLPQILVQLMGKPLVLLPQTLGPFNRIISKIIARSIIRRSKMVYTRDPDGLAGIRVLTRCDHGNIAFAHDMGFVLEPRIRTERIPAWLSAFDKEVPLVGLNVSGLLSIGGYTRGNMFGIKSEYHRLIHDLICLLIRKHRVHIMLVPHVFGLGSESESDVIASRKVYDDAEDGLRASLHIVEEGYDQHEVKALIGGCEFFMGSRMHACIAAISQCVPAVGLAYSRKFNEVFKSVGIEELVIDIREYDGNEIISAVDRAYQRRKEFREKLEENIPTVRSSVLSLFSRIPIDLIKNNH